MRKRVVAAIFLMVVLSVFPAVAHARAQAGIPAGTARNRVATDPQPKMLLVYISIWPEYEYSIEKPGQLNVLVINRFMLDSQNLKFPLKVHVKIPATALKPHVVAVGQTPESVSDQNVEYSTSVPDGNGWIDVLITATGPALQVEYYDYNIVRSGANREYVYQWPGTYETGTFHLDLRVPLRATKMRSDPDIATSGTDSDGFKFGEMSVPGMAAGKVFTVKIDYERDTDQPSTSFMQVKPSAPLDQTVNGQFSLSAYMPWIIAGLAAIVLAALGLWYWFSARSSESLPRLRKRHGPARKTADDDEPREIYCHQCGKRAQASDRFCRTCGAELRQSES